MYFKMLRAMSSLVVLVMTVESRSSFIDILVFREEFAEWKQVPLHKYYKEDNRALSKATFSLLLQYNYHPSLQEYSDNAE